MNRTRIKDGRIAYERATDGLRIDRLDLETDLVEQAHTFFDVAEQAAFAISRRDQANETQKKVKAAARERLRVEIADQEGKAPTEKRLDGEQELAPEYLEAKAEYQEACLEASRWDALKEAWRMRSHALRDLAQLHLSAHYGGGADAAYDEHRKQHAARRAAGRRAS